MRVFIHPLAIPDKGFEDGDRDRIFQVVVKTMFSKVAPPIIIFDEERFLDIWKTQLSVKNPPENIYLVPTLRDYPYPIIPGRPEPLERDREDMITEKDYEYVNEGIAIFIQLLNEVGVKKILVGGTSLEIIKGNLNRCVGNFIRFMQLNSDYEIKLSAGTAPLHRNSPEIRDSHPELL